MSRRIGLAVAWLIWTVLVAAGAGAYAYHLGTLASLPAAAAGAAPYYYWGFHPVFFFPFGFLFPLLFVFLLIWLFRPRRWYGQGPGGYGHPHRSREDAFDEWHRRAHGEAPPPAAPGTTA